MKQVTDTSKAILWWNGLNFEKKFIKAYKTFGADLDVNRLTDEDIEAIYLSEHPQPTESIKSTVTSEIISTHNSGMLAAMEFGYRECEKGNNLDMAFINFNKALKNK